MFSLHPQLQKDCFDVCDLTLCKVLLMNDSQYPWLILVPKVSEAKELCDLSFDDQTQYLHESNNVCLAMRKLFSPFKLNVAALGNVVPQLHIHHIARFQQDPAWPAPVWGKFPAIDYSEEQANQLCSELKQALS